MAKQPPTIQFEDVPLDTAVRLGLGDTEAPSSWGMTRWRLASVHQRAPVDAGEWEEAPPLLARAPAAGWEPPAGSPQVRDPRAPEVGHDRVLGGAQDGLELPVLCGGRAAPRDLPPVFV